MATRITGISSMATRSVLADIVDLFRKAHDRDVSIESVGGVDAAKRVQAVKPSMSWCLQRRRSTS
jgi:molybdate transport system substrate-binding protein